MGLADLNAREPVLRALEEFDRLGQAAFLAKYGFAPSREYWLLHRGRRYDSKAIIGAAHGFARPDLGPLPQGAFNGGDRTVRRKLEELGFEVLISGSDAANAEAFLLTWKEAGWPYENIQRMCASYARQGYVDEQWRLISHRRAKPGDKVWLLRQGNGPKVIFGKGFVTGPTLQSEQDGLRRWRAPVRFTLFVDPRKEFLIGETQVRTIIAESKIRAQASGLPLSADEARSLEQARPNQTADQTIGPGKADNEPFEPQNIEAAREKIFRSITLRRGQTAFREALMVAYDRTCAITKCAVLDVLEAAHIHPYCGPETNKIDNGLLLRTDIHTLFDCQLLTIHPETLTVILSPTLSGSEYEALHGRPVRLPRDPTQHPSRNALRLRWQAGLSE